MFWLIFFLIFFVFSYNFLEGNVSNKVVNHYLIFLSVVFYFLMYEIFTMDEEFIIAIALTIGIITIINNLMVFVDNSLNGRLFDEDLNILKNEFLFLRYLELLMVYRIKINGGRNLWMLWFYVGIENNFWSFCLNKIRKIVLLRSLYLVNFVKFFLIFLLNKHQNVNQKFLMVMKKNLLNSDFV